LVYFLLEKSKAFEVLKKYKAHVENKADKPIKVIWTNYSEEYDSHEFENFCKTHKIKRQLAVAYMPK